VDRVQGLDGPNWYVLRDRVSQLAFKIMDLVIYGIFNQIHLVTKILIKQFPHYTKTNGSMKILKFLIQEELNVI
jgi:hypothetical protein